MWWNGRHACLRCMWRELWGFKSPRRQLLNNKSIELGTKNPIMFNGCKLSASVRWGIWGKYSNIQPILAILQG